MFNNTTDHLPFDNNDLAQVWVGVIPRTFLKRENVYRSSHPSHSVAGMDPLAKKCIQDHKENDPATGPSSPYARFRELNG